MKTLCIILLTGSAAAQSGGPWDIKSYTLDGGGGRSTGGDWKVTGTIGQADATASKSTGGVSAVQGGFWPGTVAEPGGPVLTITRESATHVRLTWTAAAAGCTLQQSPNLQTWTFTFQIPSASTGGSHLWPIANGPRRYFRLKQP
ncbi:MAG: hypothetical protein KA004_01755 [Verrucomicrobiales bacterium]|nr:hypothetical protein [Verrucomicrobiales bacterium]